MNMSNSYNLADGSNRYFKDTDLLVEGPAAVQVTAHLRDLWETLAPGRRPFARPLPTPQAASSGPGLARFIVQESDLGQTAIRDYYARCFDRAQRRSSGTSTTSTPPGPRRRR